MTKNISIVSIFGAIVFLTVWFSSRQLDLVFADTVVMTGYTLLGVMLFVALFNLRKKLSMLPLARASTWLVFHVVGGLLCIAFFWLHTGTIWPQGAYESLLALVFYLVSLSGIVGYVIQRLNARKLTETGIEVIYERIPAEVAEIRERVEEIVLECTETTGSDTLANHYMDTLAWFFRRPRFYWPAILRFGNSTTWLRTNGASVERYLNTEELGFYKQVMELAELRQLIDEHYALQDINKKWLLIHLPLSVALLIMAFWHLLLVEVYAI